MAASGECLPPLPPSNDSDDDSNDDNPDDEVSTHERPRSPSYVRICCCLTRNKYEGMTRAEFSTYCAHVLRLHGTITTGQNPSRVVTNS